MFLSIVTYSGKKKRLIPLNEIQMVHPGGYGDQTIIRLNSGEIVEWRMEYDQAQDVLIDCAAQVTAPIASRIMSMENCVARLARSMEDWLEQANTPIINCDGMTPEEAERFKATMRDTRATLDSIQPRLVSQPDGTKARLMRAEALLAEVHHAWNNDADAASAIGHYLGSNIENFLYPGEKKACDKE